VVESDLQQGENSPLTPLKWSRQYFGDRWIRKEGSDTYRGETPKCLSFPTSPTLSGREDVKERRHWGEVEVFSAIMAFPEVLKTT